MAKKNSKTNPVAVEPPKKIACPVCGQSISPYSDEKGLLALNRKKVAEALKQAAKKYGKEMMQGTQGK